MKWKSVDGFFDERGNFCGNSRLVRKLTHTIYGGYLQIAAREQRTHATRRRINWAQRESPYSSTWTNMWAFCRLKSRTFHPIGRATMKLANRCESLLWLSCFWGRVSHGNTKKTFVCVERAAEEFGQTLSCVLKRRYWNTLSFWLWCFNIVGLSA